ncbi:alpha-hydroxy acid oxidase [Kineococcus rhizosphaerae]|uniref:L-lactate dehydrogenase (Cytochrome) n=1 Tax=Kineococcus rhizosphaerae TaxID=559628 RepID=A0A2T0QYT0_9ACTN|nr:alpha-hydroxy acid oxidase [Kineococcus rhizosphaerae]PRY11533.1 L-lactate dehydrogenase (cytochrome) [Kineococcus rhizosphaerae]
MRYEEVRELVQIRLPEFGRDRVLHRARTVEDFRRAARRALPRSVFDYVDGGADEEQSLRGNVAAFRRRRFVPNSLVDVSEPDLSTTVLGRAIAAPLGLAPTGYTRMISPLGEPAVARAAAAHGLPYTLSTMATTSLEDLAGFVPHAERWFQLYVWKDRTLTDQLVERAEAAGYGVLEIAIDTAVSGYRVRDVKNGFTIPPALTLSSLLDIGTKPGYWTGMLRNPALTFANVSSGGSAGYTIENITQQFDPAVTWDDVARLRARFGGKIVLKGPVSARDAVRAKDLGLDGVHLSNHGGRQLDRAVAPVDLVAGVRAAVGEEFTVLVDSGVRHGADIATAIALGADACLVGRPYLWALAAAGEDGVARVLQLLLDQFRRTLQLLGVTTVEQLRREGPDLLVEDPR